MYQNRNLAAELSKSLVQVLLHCLTLGLNKYCCFRKHGQKNRVGRSFFYFLFFFTMVLISTLSYCTRFLSLLPSSYILLGQVLL